MRWLLGTVLLLALLGEAGCGEKGANPCVELRDELCSPEGPMHAGELCTRLRSEATAPSEEFRKRCAGALDALRAPVP